MAGRYVPPSKRSATLLVGPSSQAAALPEDYAIQKELWEGLRRSIRGIVNKVSIDNIKAIAVELFRENIVRGRGLLVRTLMDAQQADPQLSQVFAAVVAIVDNEFFEVGDLLVRRLVVMWHKYTKRREWQKVGNVNRFIAQLYCFNIIDDILVKEILLAHLLDHKRTDEDVDNASILFEETFRVLGQRSPRDFYSDVLQPMGDLLAQEGERKLSVRGQVIVDKCLKSVRQWQSKKNDVAAVPPELQLVDPSQQREPRTYELDGGYDAESHLDDFAYDKEYEVNEGKFEMRRRDILGEDWEEELCQEVEDEEDQQQHVVEESGVSTALSNPQAAVSILAQEEEIQLKKKVFLAIRSSARASEIAHKILKDCLKQGTERIVCEMVVEAMCQETTYRRSYSAVSFFLCRTYGKLQHTFSDILGDRYRDAESQREEKIDYIAMFWAYLLYTDAISWSSLGCFDIIDNNVSQRLLMQRLLQSLRDTLGMEEMKRRLQADKELMIHLKKLFPLKLTDKDALKRSVDLFEGMGVGSLGDQLRERFNELRTMKREREE